MKGRAALAKSAVRRPGSANRFDDRHARLADQLVRIAAHQLLRSRDENISHTDHIRPQRDRMFLRRLASSFFHPLQRDSGTVNSIFFLSMNRPVSSKAK